MMVAATLILGPFPGRCCDNFCPSATLDSLRSIANGMSAFDGVKVSGRPEIPGKSVDIVLDVPPQSVTTKGADNEASLILGELGNPPNKEDERQIRAALNLLQATHVGKEIANSVGQSNFPPGTWEGLKKVGVEITARDLMHHILIVEPFISFAIGGWDAVGAVAPPSRVNNRTILCLDVHHISNATSGILATTVAHELAHIADNRDPQIGESNEEGLIREQHGTFVQVLIYGELVQQGVISNQYISGLDMLFSLYRWKNGGPKPDMSLRIALFGKTYTYGQLMGDPNNVKDGDDGLLAVMHMTKFFYPKLAEFPPIDDEKAWKKYEATRQSIGHLDKQYKEEWFPLNPPPPPAPTPTPAPPPSPQPPHPQPTPPDPSPEPPAPHPHDPIDPHPPHPSPNPWG